MANPLYNALFQTNQNVSTITQLAQAMKNGTNPIQMLMGLSATNPEAKSIVQALQNGANAQQLFYSLCEQKNIVPSTILNQLK